MKTSTQLKALIRNLSQDKKVEAEIILRNYMMERLLERISLSAYKNSFILKGGMLIAAIVGIDTRTTMDLDATVKGVALSEEKIVSMMKEISGIRVDDDVAITFRSIEAIHEEADYPGYRVSLDAVLDKTRQVLKVDITVGDFVTPREIEFRFQLMFEDRAINVMAYNMETVLAEKFETIITRGIANTRMRDFYDIYILTCTQQFDRSVFVAALENTTEKRDTVAQMRSPTTVIQSIASDPVMQEHWSRYQKIYSYAADISWDVAIEALHKLAVLSK